MTLGNTQKWLVAAGGFLLLILFAKKAEALANGEETTDWLYSGTDLMDRLNIITGWDWNKVPELYRSAIMAAESANGIPQGILARLLYQESHYRADIIEGRTKSRVGALGIAQFMPATAREMGINPLDPWQSIRAAGRYLSAQFAVFDDWGAALAAYNWGPGNMRAFMRTGRGAKGQAMPDETRKYYAEIMADAGYQTRLA